MGDKKYFVELKGSKNCRVRVSIKTELGRVIDLVIQLEYWEEGQWRPVARYDCAHGAPHLDLLNKAGRQEKQFFPGVELKEILGNAIEDFKKNWCNYLRRCGYAEEE